MSAFLNLMFITIGAFISYVQILKKNARNLHSNFEKMRKATLVQIIHLSMSIKQIWMKSRYRGRIMLTYHHQIEQKYLQPAYS